jgi:hypothetical protein
MVVVLVTGLILIPALLKLISIEETHNGDHIKFSRALPDFIFSLVVRYKSVILFCFVILVAVGLLGMSRIQINNYFLDDLNPKSKLMGDLMFFENEFSGIRPFELVAESRSKSIFDYEVMLKLEKVENYLIDNYQIGMVQSPVRFIKNLNRAIHGDNQEFYTIPSSVQDYDNLLRIESKYHLLQKYGNVVTDNRKMIRISGREFDLGSAIYEEKNKLFHQFLNRFDHEGISFNLTSAAHLMDWSNINITRYFMMGIALAIMIVTFMISSFTASIRITAVALLVNVIPLVFIAGAMGMFQIPLKISTALIFTIVLGISVDDTIHFLHRYLANRGVHNTTRAIQLSLCEMTRPILNTSIVLFLGFMIFSLSSFEGIKMLGVLTSLSLVVAMITDLLVLPAIILLMEQKQSPAYDLNLISKGAC